MSPTTEPDVHGMIAELTRTRSHAQPYTTRLGETTVTDRHVTRVPSLVHQLLEVTGSTSGSGDMSGSTPTSRPTARIECIDTLMLIDDEAARWLRRLGEDDPGDEFEVVNRTPPPAGPACQRCQHPSCARVRRGELVERRPIAGSGTIRCLLRLNGLLPTTERCGPKDHGGRGEDQVTWCCAYHEIVHDVRRWWRQARVIAGWDSPAYRPWATCPVCEHRGGLRVNLEMQTGFCVECRSIWGPETIGLLADHIRVENGSDTPLDESA